MSDLISWPCPDTMLLLLFPGNLENSEAVFSAVFRSISLVCVIYKSPKTCFKHSLRETTVTQDKLFEQFLKGMFIYAGLYAYELNE